MQTQTKQTNDTLLKRERAGDKAATQELDRRIKDMTLDERIALDGRARELAHEPD